MKIAKIILKGFQQFENFHLSVSSGFDSELSRFHAPIDPANSIFSGINIGWNAQRMNVASTGTDHFEQTNGFLPKRRIDLQ